MIKNLEKMFKALANVRRLEIIDLLNNRKRLSVIDLAGEIDLSYRAVSKHLGVLTKAGIVQPNRAGMNVYYEVIPNISYPLKDFLKIVCRECSKK